MNVPHPRTPDRGTRHDRAVAPRSRRARLAASVAVTGAALLVLGLTGCTPETPAPAETAPPATVEFAPVITLADGTDSFEVPAEDGAPVTFDVTEPVVTVTGVEPAIAESFVAAAGAHQELLVAEAGRATAVAPVAEWDCDPNACAFPVEITPVHSGVYEDFGTILTTSQFYIGAVSRYPMAVSATMNLRTGEPAAITDFIDPADPAVVDEVRGLLSSTEQWDVCGPQLPDIMGSVAAFSPTDDGLLLYWAGAQSEISCSVGLIDVLLPWPGTDAPQDSTTPTAAPDAATEEDVNGRWCPTAESVAADGCVTVALPEVTYENSGMTMQLTSQGDVESNGSFSFGGEGAPFGTFYPAGVPLVVPDYYPGSDLPDQDRIWNGQTGTMLIRG